MSYLDGQITIPLFLDQLTDEQLDVKLIELEQHYRACLGINFFQNDRSREALYQLDPYRHERSRRDRITQERISEERRIERLTKDLREIADRRPTNPTIGDIPKFDPDTYQKVIQETLGWAIIRTNTWDLYEFDLYLWQWKRVLSEPRRKDVIVRWDSRVEIPTQEDIDFQSRIIEERRKEISI